MNRVSFRRVFAIAGMASLVVVYAVLWVRMITSPAERTGADFIAFYAAGRIFLTGQSSEVYLPQAQQTVEQAVLGFPIRAADLNPFVHPPFILPVLALIAFLPYVGAFNVWAILLLVLYSISALLLIRTLPQGKNRRVLFAGVLLFFPAFVSILNGQDSALLLVGASIWLVGLLEGDDRLAGAGLALTAIRPHIAILLAVPFLFKQRKVWWWFLLSATGLALFSILLVGARGTQNFLHILTISANGEGYKINELAMLNIIGLLQRLFHGLSAESARIAGWLFYLLAIASLCILWLRSVKIGEKQVGLATLIAIFASPHLHYHDLVLFLIPIFCLIVLTARRSLLDLKTSVLFPLMASWLLVVSNFLPALKFSVPYILGLLLAAALWVPEFVFRQRKKLI